MGNYLTYLLLKAATFLFRIMPFRLIYILSDGLYIVVYYLVGYRREVVYGNIRTAFPEKEVNEVEKIAKGFYRHLCDILLEGMKGFSMSEEETIRRFKFVDTDFLEGIYREGKSVICLGAHYNNWEWGGIASGKQLSYLPIAFYKPLSNKRADDFVRTTRVKGRAILASINHTQAVFHKDYGEPVIFYMISDQSPSSNRMAYWTNFFNRETATLHGPEKYARQMNIPVVYANTEKLARGHYQLRFSMLVDDPSKTVPGEITAKFMETLESKIRENPQYYLWSHKRWKLKRDDV